MAMTLQQPAWGSDEEEELTSESAAAASKRQSKPSIQNPQRLESQPAASVQVPSLQALCLGVLGDYLVELLECAGPVLPLLPAQFKACLLAIARRQQLLDDRVLGILADEEQVCLDCHNSPVTEPALRRVLAASPGLRLLDLTGCPVGPGTLRLLGDCCPRLEVLRIGGHAVTDGGGCSGPLRRLLPQLEKSQGADVDSWEALADRIAADTELAAPGGRLMSLQCLVWPSMPSELQRHCRAACPLLLVNPTLDDVAKQGLPPEFHPDCALDAKLFAGLGDPSRWEAGLGGEEPVVHIAERFRLAYQEQAQRLRERAERAERRRAQQRRREIRRSPAEVAIRRWLNEA